MEAIEKALNALVRDRVYYGYNDETRREMLDQEKRLLRAGLVRAIVAFLRDWEPSDTAVHAGYVALGTVMKLGTTACIRAAARAEADAIEPATTGTTTGTQEGQK